MQTVATHHAISSRLQASKTIANGLPMSRDRIRSCIIILLNLTHQRGLLDYSIMSRCVGQRCSWPSQPPGGFFLPL